MTERDEEHSKHAYLSVEMLTRLGQVTGHRFDMERLSFLIFSVYGRADGDPMARLSLAADELGLHLTPARMPLSEAVWKARSDTPVMLWCEKEERFLIVSGAGGFLIRLAEYGASPEKDATISRAKLAQKLGLSSVNESIEVGLIHSQRPVERASFRAIEGEDEEANRYSTLSHRTLKSENHNHQSNGAGHHMHPFTRFVKLISPERKEIWTLLIFAVFSGVLYLALPFAVDTVVTNLAFGGQAKPYVQALIVVAKILAVCLLLQAFVIAFQYYVSEVIQRRIFVRTASDLAFRLPRVKAEALDGVHGPELVNRFLDIVTVQKNTAFFLLEGINLLAASVIGMLLLSLYHPLLLVFVIVLIILIISVTWLLGRRGIDTAIRESRSKYDLVGWFEEIATFPLLFKGPGGYDLAFQRTNALATEFVDARTAHFKIIFRQVAALLLLSVVSSVLLLILGTMLVLNQHITLGQLVASELIMSSIVVALIKLGKKLEAWYDTMAAIDKLGHIFDLETESSSGETASKVLPSQGMAVEASGISFGHRPKDPLFQDLSFSIKPGDRVSLYGPQGSGVSSLLDLLFTVRKPTDGFLSFDGLDSRNWQLEKLRKSVMLLRRDEFIDGTIIENVRFGCPELGMHEIRNALDRVGLLEELLREPDGLNTRLRLGGGPLPTSSRIRLLFARAIAHAPSLLLIDELLDGLEESTYNSLVKLVLSGEQNWSIIIATRMENIISICDQSIKLDGKINKKPQDLPPESSSKI